MSDLISLVFVVYNLMLDLLPYLNIIFLNMLNIKYFIVGRKLMKTVLKCKDVKLRC